MANPYESGERKVIPAVLIYARAGDRVLMIHRNTGAKAAARSEKGEEAALAKRRGVTGAAGSRPERPLGRGKEGPGMALLYNDYHEGKWNGLGGKLEPGESPAEAAARELREESGIEAAPEDFRPLGVVQFPDFKAHKSEDWVVWVYSLRLPESALARALPGCAEGDLHWIPARDLLSLSLWAGDRHFIPFVVEERPFQGTIWYRGQEVLRHQVAAL